MIVEGSFDGFGLVFLILIVQQTFQWLISRQGADNLVVSPNIAHLILIAIVIVSSIIRALYDTTKFHAKTS